MGATPFRFENVWLENPDFKGLMNIWWKELKPMGWAGFKFMEKLKGLKLKIRESNKENCEKMINKKKNFICQIEQLDLLEEQAAIHPQQIQERKILKAKLLEATINEQRDQMAE